MWGEQRADPPKGVWRRSPQRGLGALTDPLLPPPITKTHWIRINVPRTPSGKSAMDVSTQVHAVATTLLCCQPQETVCVYVSTGPAHWCHL